MRSLPVLYLDVDDTLVSWRGGSPRAAPGAGEFLEWALERYEVRWLTSWCPSGEMTDSLLHDLTRMLGVPPELLRSVRGIERQPDASKLNGIAWLEHLVLERPFLWLEDEYGVGPRELAFLAEYGFTHAYRRVNVTVNPAALELLHASLRRDPPAPA